MDIRNETSPIFLVGSERSGTTLLRLMLDHHPRIGMLYESDYLVDRIDADGNYPDLPGFRDYLASHRAVRGADLAVDESLDYEALVKSFLTQKLQRDSKVVPGATVHWSFEKLPLIWPRARYVHLVRDPRAVARSVMAMGWAGNAWSATERWVSAQGAWERLAQQVSEDQLLVVQYESLIRDSEGTLSSICDFAGVEFDRGVFDYAANSTYDLPDPALIGRWRKSLADRQVQLIEARCEDYLEARGYEPSGLPKLHLGAATRGRLTIQNKLYRLRRGVQRFGLRNMVAGFFARRIGSVAWQQRVQLRKNAIQDRESK